MKYLLSLILLPFFLAAQVEKTPTQAAPALSSEPKTENDFSLYTTIGATTYAATIINLPNANQFTGGDIGMGVRSAEGKHIWDAMMGLQGNKYFQGFYIQNSYLFYPLAPRGIYFGIGFYLAYGHTFYKYSARTYSYYWRQRSFPIMLGYQLQKSFVQIRMMATGQLDFAYGFEF